MYLIKIKERNKKRYWYNTFNQCFLIIVLSEKITVTSYSLCFVCYFCLPFIYTYMHMYFISSFLYDSATDVVVRSTVNICE